MMPRVLAAEILKERWFSTADVREGRAPSLRLIPNLWDVASLRQGYGPAGTGHPSERRSWR